MDNERASRKHFRRKKHLYLLIRKIKLITMKKKKFIYQKILIFNWIWTNTSNLYRARKVLLRRLYQNTMASSVPGWQLQYSDIKTVSKRLGHANIQTTGNIYTHQIRSADEQASEVIDLVLRQKKQPMKTRKNSNKEELVFNNGNELSF